MCDSVWCLYVCAYHRLRGKFALAAPEIMCDVCLYVWCVCVHRLMGKLALAAPEIVIKHASEVVPTLLRGV